MDILIHFYGLKAVLKKPFCEVGVTVADAAILTTEHRVPYTRNILILGEFRHIGMDRNLRGRNTALIYLAV